MALIPLPGRADSRSPQTRLIIYIFLAAACFYLFFALRKFHTGKIQTPSKDFQEYINAEVIKDKLDPLAGIDSHKRLLIDTINIDIGNSADDPQAANTLSADSTSIEYILSYLKGIKKEDLAAQVSKNNHYTYARLMESPNKWRGRVIHFYGVLLQKDLEEFPDMPEGLRKMWRLTLTDPYQAHFYTVLTPQISKSVKVLGIVSFEGIFLKRYAYHCKPDPKRSSFWQWTPLFVAKKAYYKWEPLPKPDLLSDPEEKIFKFKETVNSLDKAKLESILDVSKSGKGFSSLGRIMVSYEDEARNIKSEKKAFEHLFQYISSFSDKELASKVNRRINFENVMIEDKAPKWAKWQVAEVTGRVRFVERIPVKGLQSGLKMIYILIIYDENSDNFEWRWSVALPSLPHPLREGDRVRVRGLFTKFYPYLSINNDWRWTPMLTAVKIKKIPFKPEKTSFTSYIVITILVFAICFGIYYNTTKDDERREKLRKSIKEKRAAADAIKAVKKIKSKESEDVDPPTLKL